MNLHHWLNTAKCGPVPLGKEVFKAICRRSNRRFRNAYFDKRNKEFADYWQALKGKFCGKRGFVIGNGPSLRVNDLDLLKNEITIASNKIYLAFESTDWRPSFYTVCDPIVWKKIQSEIPGGIMRVHCPSYLEQNGLCSRPVIIWKSLTYAGVRRSKDPDFLGVEFSDNACNGFYVSSTVTFENLQLAVHLGLNPIYIIGCDHFYAGETNVKPDNPIVAGSVQNHFHPDYRKPGEIVNPAPIHIMERGYKEARIFSDLSGVEIYNATRGGHLNIFKRVDLDAVLSETHCG